MVNRIYQKWKLSTYVEKFNYLIMLLAIGTSMYLVIGDNGNIGHMVSGAGDYYYTDIPGFDQVFAKGKVMTGTKHPVAFSFIFIAWGIVSWKMITRIERGKK